MSAQTKKPEPEWLKARRRQASEPAHQKLTERDSKRGTHRDMYLLADRIFMSTPGYKLKGVTGYSGQKDIDGESTIRTKPELVLFVTKRGPRRQDRVLRKGDMMIRDENIKLKKRAARARAERRARQDQRRRRRGAHKR